MPDEREGGIEAPAGGVTPSVPAAAGRVARGASIVALGTLVSRVLGVARDITLAAVFRRDVTDAFFVAFTIPNLLRQVVGEGAMSSAVIPVLAQTRADGAAGGAEGADKRVREVFARLRGLSLGLLIVLSVLGVAFATPLTELFASGLHARPGAFESAARMTRGVFPYIFFMGSAALGAAALQVERRFFTTSFAPALLNVAFVACAWFLPPRLPGWGLERADALVIAALLGGALQMFAQWPELSRLGYFSRPKWPFGDPAVREVVRRFVPQLFGVGVYYIDIVIARRFLSGLGEGAQSYFTWAQRLCDLPQGIFVMAISTASLPALAELARGGDRAELRKTFAFGLRLALFVAIPSAVALVFFGESIVRLIFQRGAFDALSTAETARALQWQGAAVLSVAVSRQTSSLFFAMGDTKTPTVVSAIDLVVFIVAAVFLRERWGHAGVSAAVCASSFAQAVLLGIAATRKLGRAEGVFSALLGMLAVAAMAAAVCRFVLHGGWLGTGRAKDVIIVSGFGVLYVIFAWIGGIEEIRTLFRAFAGRFATKR